MFNANRLCARRPSPAPSCWRSRCRRRRSSKATGWFAPVWVKYPRTTRAVKSQVSPTAGSVLTVHERGHQLYLHVDRQRRRGTARLAAVQA